MRHSVREEKMWEGGCTGNVNKPQMRQQNPFKIYEIVLWNNWKDVAFGNTKIEQKGMTLDHDFC